VARNDCNSRTGSYEQTYFAFGNYATAYNQAGAALHLQKDWQMIHVNYPGLRLSTLSTVSGKLK
jgi:hypothetical protein